MAIAGGSAQWGEAYWGAASWGELDNVAPDLNVAIEVAAPTLVVVYPPPAPGPAIIEVVAGALVYIPILVPGIIEVIPPLLIGRVPQRVRHTFAVLTAARQRISHTWIVVPEVRTGLRLTHTWKVRKRAVRMHHRWRVLEVDPRLSYDRDVHWPIALAEVEQP